MINEIWKKLAEKKILVVMLIVGILIMIVPKGTAKNVSGNRILQEDVNRIEVEKLEKIISKINGVEICDVFIAYENQGENKFAYDVHSGSGKDLEIKLSDKEPLVTSVNNPEIRGVFALVKGRNIEVREIAHIIKGATGTPLHRICVKIVGEE